MVSLREIQLQHGVWADTNFPQRDDSVLCAVLGVSEEVGELCHAVLKQRQLIRGTHEEHDAAAKDAVGDIVLYLLHLCHLQGWDIEDIIEDTFAIVNARNWVDNPEGGV